MELKIPHGHELADLTPLLPIFLAYALSFRSIRAYWNNHHHLFKGVKEVNPKIMWANLHFLFWPSLIPFATGWFGENYNQSWPTALYGILLLLTAFAYQILQRNITTDKQSLPLKGKISLLAYLLSVILAFINPIFSVILFILVAGMWFIPEKNKVKEM